MPTWRVIRGRAPRALYGGEVVAVIEAPTGNAAIEEYAAFGGRPFVRINNDRIQIAGDEPYTIGFLNLEKAWPERSPDATTQKKTHARPAVPPGTIDRVTGHPVLDALKAISGISCPPPKGPREGVIDYVRLQHRGTTLAHAVARDGYANLQRLPIDPVNLPKAAIGDLLITSGGKVRVDEANIAQGVKLVKYLVAQQHPGRPATAIPPPQQPQRRARQNNISETDSVTSTAFSPAAIAPDSLLRDFIGTIAATFDRTAGMSSPTQQLLRSAPRILETLTPVGFRVVGSGGAGVPAVIPWFGFLDPDETDSPHQGLYVVYLFSADLARVYLTLIQGITKLHSVVHPPREARLRLDEDGERLRAQLGTARMTGFEVSIDLGAGGRLPAGYESGAVAATQYTAAALPAETVLQQDLTRMLDLYQDAIRAKVVLLMTQPGAIATPSGTGSGLGEDESTFDHFKPKSSAEYWAHLEGGTFKRRRRHEALIKEYGDWARANGFKASTKEHPKDLVLRREGVEWMLEGEVLRHGNAAHAGREAIGQLLEYRRFLYTDIGKPAPVLVGLFSEDVGEAYLGLLEELGILTVWREGLDWRGCETARTAGLTSV